MAKATKTGNPSKQIDKEIASLPDWRGKTLATIRKIVWDADSEVTEEWKWMGTPVWCHTPSTTQELG